MPPPNSTNRAGAGALRQFIAVPAFLLVVATQLGLTGVVALTSFISVASSHATFSAWVAASAVTVAAGSVSWLFSRWLWRALANSSALVVATWLFAAGTIFTSQLTFAVLRELARGSTQTPDPSWAALRAQPQGDSLDAFAGPEDRFGACVNELSRAESLRSAKQRAQEIVGDEAEDVVQRTILAVCALHARRRIELLFPYFLRSVENLATRARASRWNAGRCEFEESPCAWDTEEYMVRAERLSAVQAALCHLGSSQRQVVEGRLDGLSDEELAARLGTTRENVRQLASRGNEKIRAILAENEDRCNR